MNPPGPYKAHPMSLAGPIGVPPLTIHAHRDKRTGSRCDLAGRHRRTLEGGSAIAREVLEENGVWTIRRGLELPEGFSSRQRRRGAGMLFSVTRPNGETGYSFRPDVPDPDNPGHKYEQPCKALGGPGNVLGLMPGDRHLVADTSVPVVFVEGTKKMLAAVSAVRRAGAAVLVVSISGVWNWLSDGKPIADMLEIRMEGRKVYIGFDSDVFRNPDVGRAARGLAGHLQGRGATVYLSYLDDQADGSKTGADDFMAAGHRHADYMATFRPFDANDLQAERLLRDVRLRLALADLERRFWRFDWSGMGPHSARDVALTLLEAARTDGKPVEGGVRVAMAWGDLELAARVSRRTLAKAIEYLEAWGILYRVKDGRKPGKRGAFVLCGKVNQYGEGDGEATVLTPIGIPCRAPRLRHSSPGSRPRRGLVSGTRKVRESPPRKPKPAVKRPGKIRGGILDHLDRAGGELTLLGLDEAMRPDKPAEKRRPRDLVRRKNPETGKGRDGLLIWWIDAGVVELEGDKARLTPGWIEALDEQRRLGLEIDTVDVSGRVEAGADTIARRDLQRRRDEYREFRAKVEREKAERRKPRAEACRPDGTISELRPVEAPPEAPVSPLAAAVRGYLDRSPADARRSPYWIGVTLWAHDLYPGKPTQEEVREAVRELGGTPYLEAILKRTRRAA